MHRHKRLLLAAASVALVAGVAVVATAQPVIAEMKVKIYETWVEMVYDVTPGTVGDAIVTHIDGSNTRVIVGGDLRVCDTTAGCPSVGVSTSDGELFVEGDIESDGNLNVAGTATFTSGVSGNLTVSGDLDVDGGAGALDFTGSGASSVLLADNDSTALLIGSTGVLNLMTFDTFDNGETVKISGTTGATSLDVAVGLASFAEPASFLDYIELSDGLRIDQSANNKLTITEGSETWETTVSSNALDVASSTGIAEINYTSIALNSATVSTHLMEMRFCGNSSDGATSTYTSFVNTRWTTNYEYGGTGCDGEDSTTETSADEIYHAGFAFKPVAMACVITCTGASAANDLVAFQLRDDVTDVTGMTCSAQLAGDGVPVQCTVRDPTPATVAAGSTIAMQMTGVDDDCNDAGDDVECLVYFTF